MRKTVEIVSKALSIVLLLLLIACVKTQAQTYPVQVNTQLQAPYSPFLTDYTEIGAQRLLVNFRLNDPTLPEYRGKLRLTIEGVGITIRTKQNFIPQQPLILQGGGIPLILYGEDLEEYFNPNNLDFAGISKSQYEKGAELPEGVYRFTIEVLDYNRNTVVSNKGTAIAWIILNDPVLLNLPRNESKAAILDPTNIAFTWTPRHTGSPNSAFTTEYIFKLVEIWPASRNPYDAFLSQQPLYETTTSSTQIVYGPAEPALIPGRKYAWQVQAKDTEGRDLFKNEGKSEVYVFQFGDELGIPENLSLQRANPSSLIVRWEQPVAGADIVTYTVRYRPHGKRNHDNWYIEKTADQWKAISQLQPNTEYEVQVRAEQGAQVSDYGTVKIFKTAIAGANDFVCKSDVLPPAVPANAIRATKLAINDTIYAAGYEVLVRELTANEGGTYTGSGMMIVPWFQSAKVHMTFKNIRVNEQHWLTAGEIKSVWNADSKFLVKSEKKVDSTNAPLNGELPVNIVATETLIEITGAAIATVTKDEEGNIEVYTTDGEKKVLPKGKSYSIADEVGNGYVVDEKGNITKTTADEARAAAGRGDRNYTIALTFNKGNGKYGFDEMKYEALSSYYQQLPDGHYIPWKAVTASQPDAVTAALEGTDIDADKVRFEINGSKVPATNSGSNYTLSVRGGAEGMVEELLALYTPSDTAKDNVLGKLNLVSYDQLTRNLVIVPVNGATIPGGLSASILSQKLTEIYGQAVAAWDVKIEPSIKVSLDDTFDDGESGLLTNYTGDMKKVIKAYGSLQDKTCYIFLVTKPKSGNTLGYMPRSKQAGFIFIDKLNSTNVVNTLAHEIGHGAFNLQHTFKEYPSLAQGSTDNLMDYGNGTFLCKYQWSCIHEPQKVRGLFEDDEDGALKEIKGKYTVYVGDSIMKEKKIFTKTNKTDKLYAKYEPVVSDTSKFIYTKVSFRVEGSKKETYIPANNAWNKIKVNTKVAFSIDSLSEGKYSVLFKGKSEKVDTIDFFIRSKNYDFACAVCGRDLTVTLDKLDKLALEKKNNLTEQDAKLLNDLLKQAGFNTCKSHAHFFSQSAHETSGFSKFVEDTYFSINGFYNGATFSKNCNTKILYNQSFWSNKTYKEYFAVGDLYELSSDTTAKKKYQANKDDIKKYKWGASQASKSDFSSCLTITVEKKDTIKYPNSFRLISKVSKGSDFYVKYTLSKDQKKVCGEKLYSLLYATYLGNGSASTSDGYNYRGRGFVHLTGRDNYRDVSNKCNSFFKTNFDFEKDFEKLTTDMKYVIYSAVAFYLYKNAVSSLHKKNCLEVTKIVNGSKNGYDDKEHTDYMRLSLFKKFKDDIFYGCNIKENE